MTSLTLHLDLDNHKCYKMFLLVMVSFSIFQHFHCETLIWSDEFDFLDETKWTHMVTTYPLVK